MMRYTTTSVGAEEPPMPWTIGEPDRKRSVNWQLAARLEITRRARFTREREDHAAAQWRRTGDEERLRWPCGV